MSPIVHFLLLIAAHSALCGIVGYRIGHYFGMIKGVRDLTTILKNRGSEDDS